MRLENCEGACVRAKYGALCCVGTVNKDKIERRDTIQNMDGKRGTKQQYNASLVLLNRESDCDY